MPGNNLVRPSTRASAGSMLQTPDILWSNTTLCCTHQDKDKENVHTLRPRQNGRRFADDTFKCIFLNENVRILIKISLKFVPKGPINNNPALVQIMAWRQSGDKPLSEPMMVSLLMHICVTRPQWVNQTLSLQKMLLSHIRGIKLFHFIFSSLAWRQITFRYLATMYCPISSVSICLVATEEGLNSILSQSVNTMQGFINRQINISVNINKAVSSNPGRNFTQV